MVLLEPLREKNILIVAPQGPLGQADFETIAKAVDACQTSEGKVAGLMITIGLFPGWQSFSAFTAHLKFVARHHRRIHRIAVVTNSALLKIVPGIAGVFLHPEIRKRPASRFL
ncbi:tRNA U38,U39,U40 pseudouridine synthase TruA [Pararhizobium capsulatum DSM 1112]|uniref:tRNA U38,U39,U40 pseudouridine synthase TruA n=1 Tax=Pararhizobium capsulatum DSM 1112 TaxID=1121113 RepID=A0ABU0BJQ0_9HYPH|nr:STAS/SEC14 domain-containing protein [Pararhizobium capsulatum]MDQ0318476.1 tRNA U38,U39,U40 pseudouridine synthase TruA [Pararhizobium capsulatum DSM 1112]